MSFIYSFVVIDDVSYRYLPACYYCYYYWSSNLRVHILTLQAEHSINIHTHACIQFFFLIEILRTSVNVVEQIEKRIDSLSQMMNVVGND
jgi:hypothetical protein